MVIDIIKCDYRNTAVLIAPYAFEKPCVKIYLNDSVTGTRQLQIFPKAAVSHVLIYREQTYIRLAS